MSAFPVLSPLGLADWLVRFGDRLSAPANRAALAFAAELRETPLPALVEVAPALASVHLVFDPMRADPDDSAAALRTRLDGRDWTQAPLPAGALWTLPAAFGGAEGPQLEEAAALAGLGPEAAVASLCAAPLRVLALGFAPGQPYLGPLDPVWEIPRQTKLTGAVPRGALCVAVGQMVLFARQSPTGWRQVGRTAFAAFRPGASTPVPLAPGDQVRFEPVSAETLAGLEVEGRSGARRVPP